MFVPASTPRTNDNYQVLPLLVSETVIFYRAYYSFFCGCVGHFVSRTWRSWTHFVLFFLFGFMLHVREHEHRTVSNLKLNHRSTDKWVSLLLNELGSESYNSSWSPLWLRFLGVSCAGVPHRYRALHCSCINRKCHV